MRCLFLRNGLIAGPDHLLAHPLGGICQGLAILNGVAKTAIHPHRFRLDAVACDTRDTAERARTRARS